MEIFVSVATQDAIDRLVAAAEAYAKQLERQMPHADEEFQFAFETALETMKRDAKAVKLFSETLNGRRER